MAIVYEKKKAIFAEQVSVEEAEGLLEWLRANPKAKLDLAACTHLHTAILQVLMAAKPHISVWPKDAGLALWIKGAIESKPGV